jgi:phospholipid/cholesterol/gamma-HCH transport system substrate-binding protein
MSANRRSDTLRLALKLGVFAGISALLTTVVVTSVLDLNLKPSSTYHAVFTNSTGLQNGDTVRIAGVEVGKVNSVTVLTGKGAARCQLPGPYPNCAYVTFTVDSTEHLTTTTHTAIDFANLLGQRFLAVVPGPAGGAPLHGGATVPVTLTQPGLDLTAVFNGFQPLFTALTPNEVNELAASVIQVFQGQSGTVANLVSETANITNNLANREQILDEVLNNLSGLLQAVGGESTQLGQLIHNFNVLVSGLAGERSQLGSAIDGLATLNGAFANVLHQSRPALDQSIAGLASATGTLSQNQASLNGVINGLPPVLAAISKTISTGSYANVYLCNLTINIHGAINVSLNPALPAPQFPSPVVLPSGTVGGPVGSTSALWSQLPHTRNCQP